MRGGCFLQTKLQGLFLTFIPSRHCLFTLCLSVYVRRKMKISHAKRCKFKMLFMKILYSSIYSSIGFHSVVRFKIDKRIHTVSSIQDTSWTIATTFATVRSK